MTIRDHTGEKWTKERIAALLRPDKLVQRPEPPCPYCKRHHPTERMTMLGSLSVQTCPDVPPDTIIGVNVPTVRPDMMTHHLVTKEKRSAVDLEALTVGKRRGPKL